MKNPSLNEFLFGGTTEFPEGFNSFTELEYWRNPTFHEFKSLVKSILETNCYCPISDVGIDVDDANADSIHFELPDDETLAKMYENRVEFFKKKGE